MTKTVAGQVYWMQNEGPDEIEHEVSYTARFCRDTNADCDADGNRGRDVIWVDDVEIDYPDGITEAQMLEIDDLVAHDLPMD